MNLFGLTDIGIVRKDNQDSYAIRALDEQVAVAVVCDGMGGARAGNVASAVAVESFAAAVEASLKNEIPADPMAREDILADACHKANAQVYELAASQAEYRGMGTTLVAALVLPDEIYVVNVGDSRCYLFTPQGAHQITQDHSLVQVLVDRGELTPEEARIHPKKNLITRALGVDTEVVPDLYRVSYRRGDHLLLCSDGLTNVLADDAIRETLRGDAPPEVCCRELLKMTLTQGAPDNVTVVLAQL